MSIITSVNPATSEHLRVYSLLDSSEINKKIEQAKNAQQIWASLAIVKRSEFLMKVSRLLIENGRVYAELITREMGKPISESRSEIEKCAWVCKYYAENAQDQLKDVLVESDASRSYIHYQPIGIVLAVMPWNFPFWQVFRFIAPALMAGNGGLLKHASNVPGCAEAIERIFIEAEMPIGIFGNLHISSDQVKSVIEHAAVAAVTLTGSGPAGSAVAEIAGKEIKKSVLELGGSDPYMILEDADLQKAAQASVQGRMLNAGQSCIAAKRFIVLESVHDSFVALVRAEIQQLVMGDPMDTETDIGPLAKISLRDELHDQVKKSIDQGAHCLLGGEIPEGPGAFYPPTLLINVKPGMPVFDEETFGPVACVIKAQSQEEALMLAACTEFGLGAAVFTRDLARAKRIAESGLIAGSCFINTFVRSDPRLPFGGIKKSGYGRELSSMGIKEFVNAKTIYVK